MAALPALLVASHDWRGPARSPASRPPPAAAAAGPLPTDNDALRLAAADLARLDHQTQLTTRYLWVSDGELESFQAAAFALNAVSRSSVIVRPTLLGKDRLMVARVDLRAYFPRAQDLADAINTWEELRFEPRFNLLLTPDTLKFNATLLEGTRNPIIKVRKVVRKVLVACPRYLASDGNWYHEKEEDREFEERIDVGGTAGGLDGTAVVRLVAKHLDQQAMANLVAGTASQAPVVSERYFLARVLSTIQGKGTARDLYSGLYYRFLGIKSGFEKGTDEDNFLAGLGVGNVEAGVTAAKVFERLRSDQRVAVFRSGVTGKPRRVDLLRTLAGRDGQSLLLVTHDLKDDDVDLGTHPIMNLLDFQDAAREVIFEKANGLHGFVLFNGQGKLQDEAPFDVVLDHKIPEPHTKRLQGAISCIRCHGPEGGWRKLSNDVQRVVKHSLDAFADSSSKGSLEDTLDRLAGLYAGNLELKLLPRARDDYASAVLRATGRWKGSRDQTDATQLASAKVALLYGRYVFDLVYAQDALRDLGIECEPSQAAETFRKLVPPVGLSVDGIVPEDPRVGALRDGLGIPRSDFDLIFSFLAARVKR